MKRKRDQVEHADSQSQDLHDTYEYDAPQENHGDHGESWSHETTHEYVDPAHAYVDPAHEYVDPAHEYVDPAHEYEHETSVMIAAPDAGAVAVKDSRILRRRSKRRRTTGNWIIVLTLFIVTAIALWQWLFPWLDKFVNNPALGGS